MRTTLMVLAGTAVVAIGLANAANPPWGGDDTGWLPPVGSAVNKCETNIGKQASKLVDKIGKCHAGRIAGKLADPTAEDACTAALTTKFTTKVKTVGCDACTNLTLIAGVWDNVTDSAIGAILCGAGTPMGGDDAGNIPAAPAAAKCAIGVVKAVGKLNGALAKCHISRATGKIASEAGEDVCEAAALSKFTTKTKTTGCDPCVNLGTLALMSEFQIDQGNSLTYCQSPSSAFVEKNRGYMESLF